jgi:hypothetical protein
LPAFTEAGVCILSLDVLVFLQGMLAGGKRIYFNIGGQ